jgi:hypothetical protein
MSDERFSFFAREGLSEHRLEREAGWVSFFMKRMSMPTPSQSSAFPTFLQYWKNLIQPKRRTVPILKNPVKNDKSKKRTAAVPLALEGQLAVSSSGSYAIDGNDFAIDSNTTVLGDLRVGVNAKVSCVFEAGRRKAVKIVLG